MIVTGHTIKHQGSDCQIYFSPLGKYYYIYKHTTSGEKYPVEISYNKERKE